MTSREFNHNTSKAKRAAADGPVYITDRGEPALVLMTYDEFRRLGGRRRNILEILASPETADLDIEFPRWDEAVRPAEFD